MNTTELLDSRPSWVDSKSEKLYDWSIKASEELRRLQAENQSLKSVQEDYEQAARILHGAADYEATMLKPLANKAQMVMQDVAKLSKEKSFECYSVDDGCEHWVECPDDCDIVDGKELGEKFELMCGWYAVRREYVVTKVPDDVDDEYVVEMVENKG